MTYHLTCRLCSAEMDSGVVCSPCVGGMMADLRALWATGDVHGLDVDLDIAIAKQSRFGGGGGGRGGGDEIPMLINEAASDTRRYLHSMLSTWCRVVIDQCGGTPPADTIPAMAQWLHGQGVIIRSAEWGDECVTQIRYVVREVRRCVDRPAERVYAGECPTCTGKVYGIAGADRAWCRTEGCDGEIEDPEARRDEAVKRAVAAAPDREVTAKEASLASRFLGGKLVTDRTIRKMAADGRITATTEEGVSPAKYKLGHIMTALNLPRKEAIRVNRERTLEEVLKSELMSLWYDMEEARRVARNGCWSMGCENVAGRIQAITNAIGPVSWEEVPITIFREGEDAFERVHAEIGIEVDPEDIGKGREACARYLATQRLTA